MDNDVVEGWMTMQLKDGEGENFFSFLKEPSPEKGFPPRLGAVDLG